VFVTATLQKNQQILRTAEELRSELDEFEKTLPPGVTVERGFDQAKNVAARLGGLTHDLMLAIALVLVTLLPLGGRPAIIVMISIPLSLSMGVALLYLTGFGINQLSIAGLVIALGLLVDDSIVVVENIARFIRKGEKPLNAAINATGQIGMAVLGTTATLIFSFVPLIFLPGTSGMYIRSLPVSVIYAIISSLVVSLTIVPFLSRILLREEKHEGGNKVFQATMGWIHRVYRPVLHTALKHPWRTIAVAVALFVGSIMLIPLIGFSLFPKAGIPQFMVVIETPEGTSLDRTNDVARFVERTLQSTGRMKYVFSSIGSGNPEIYYNVTKSRERNNAAEVIAEVTAFDPDRTPKFLDSLRGVFAGYPNARIELREFENGPPLDAPIAIRLIGDDLDSLSAGAKLVTDIMHAIPGTQYVHNPLKMKRTDIRIDIDRDRAGLSGVLPAEIDRTLRLAVAGLEVGKYKNDEGKEYAINVTMPHGKKQTVDVLDRISVNNINGTPIPLRQLGRTRFETSPTLIRHYNRERSITVTSYTESGFNTDRVTNGVLSKIAASSLPKGVRYEAAGEIESRKESFGGMGSAIIVAFFGIFAILVLEFGTFKSTLIVLSVVPLGVIGGLLALLFSGNTLSFTALIGFVALVGIEVKNSILLVDFTNLLRSQGKALDEAIEQAGEIRFFPILLTTMTALGGLLPLAIQRSPLYSPLAWVIIGGLITSTVLTRVVTPVIYKMFAPAVEPEARG
jgi:multidrug efflux pump subunit AcrB